MYNILSIINANPKFKPRTLDEKIKVDNLISMEMINPIGSETQDEYMALLLTRRGRDYLRRNLR